MKLNKPKIVNEPSLMNVYFIASFDDALDSKRFGVPNCEDMRLWMHIEDLLVNTNLE